MINLVPRFSLQDPTLVHLFTSNQKEGRKNLKGNK